MKLNENNRLTTVPGIVRSLALALLVLPCSTLLNAQDASVIRQQQPDLANLFNAFDTSQARTLEHIVAINSNPATAAGRGELRMHLEEMANMDSHDMHGGHGGMAMDHSTQAHFTAYEVEARIELLDMLEGDVSDDAAAEAYVSSSAIDRHTAEVFTRGRAFERNLFAIYLDSSITDKQAAVQAAINQYLEDDRHSVATSPKNVSMLVDHEQATALKIGYPLLAKFLWANQWMQLASLEAVILDAIDNNARANGLATAEERFRNKLGSPGGMSVFPAPEELPMVPAIAPDLYSQSPEAAHILDNLNVLETIVADVLAYPDLEAREEIIASVVADFTNKEENITASMDYLLFALRGGIYNQGGPAVGELMQSERNRAREAMDMVHTMIMSSPQ